MTDRIGPEALTFDDVLLVPGKATVHPREVAISTRFTRNIPLNVPILSAAMDTVTEAELAIALAREGGIGVIHKNLSIAEQAAQVDRVKRSESGMIVDPITLEPDAPLSKALDLMANFSISGVPITTNGKLVGILTNRDHRFETNFLRPIREVMTPEERLVTAPIGTTLEEAREILHRHRIDARDRDVRADTKNNERAQHKQQTLFEIGQLAAQEAFTTRCASIGACHQPSTLPPA